MSDASNGLRGRRILLVGDEYALADELDMALRDAGAEVVGPFPRVGEALDAVRSGERLDGAVLDVNLAGEMVWPAADALGEHRVPVVLTTGYDAEAIPREHAGLTRLQKPVQGRAVVRALLQALTKNEAPGSR